MNVITNSIEGLLIFQPQKFADDRGYFFETWSMERYHDAGITEPFVQDNISVSRKGTLRGLHFQNPNAQGKLVQVLQGKIFDVAVDIRVDSDTFGKWESIELSAENQKQMYIPPGFAHGFCVISETAMFSYKCTDYYTPAAENGIIWNDPEIGIQWPIDNPVLSEKDLKYSSLSDIPHENLPSLEQL
jgi:dTDP-4-dehydrorhamnose 3,5-epimerase